MAGKTRGDGDRERERAIGIKRGKTWGGMRKRVEIG